MKYNMNISVVITATDDTGANPVPFATTTQTYVGLGYSDLSAIQEIQRQATNALHDLGKNKNK